MLIWVGFVVGDLVGLVLWFGIVVGGYSLRLFTGGSVPLCFLVFVVCCLLFMYWLFGLVMIAVCIR